MSFAIPTDKTHAIRKDTRHIEHIENVDMKIGKLHIISGYLVFTITLR